ncbi:transglutaminaseTgpA domain-containing protein [Kitasatospora sp. KL5]|uniref:transglutaminase family protein n=1 Tax=Kitasatospora sp. KL5 TaxID=3425125 RepID=UPI003D6FE73D
MTTRARLTICAATATALTAMCLLPLLTTHGWAGHALLMIMVAAGAGSGLRRLAVAGWAVTPVQLLVVLYVLMLTSVRSSMAWGLLPGGRALDALGGRLGQAGTDLAQYSVPAPDTPGLRLVLVGSVALIAVLVDALAVTHRRAAAAGLPLLALYSVGCGLSGLGSGAWIWFLPAAGGYLLLLRAEGQDRLSRWGRVFSGTGKATNSPPVHSGHRVGVAALVLALAVPAFLPQAGLGLVGGLAGSGGSGSGIGRSGQVTSLNPVVALTESLHRTDPVPLLQYRTNASTVGEMYLRIGALDEFNGVDWRFSQQKLQQRPDPLPKLEGLSSAVAISQAETDVSISENLRTDWLPMPYPASRVSVPGSWRYEPETRALVGADGQKTDGVKYSVSSLQVEATAEQLRSAGPVPADLPAKYLQLPQTLPAEVSRTARTVTAGKDTSFDRAVALQEWFTSSEFHYDTDIEAGTGNTAILKFLQDRRGFCVHFASTMAAMARSLGIPARVAIGFTPGSSNDGKVYVVRSTNYHAWPELYFAGTGWVRFEPTPSAGQGAVVPSYTREQAEPSPGATTAQPGDVPSDAASAAPGATNSCGGGHRIEDCGDQQTAADQAVGNEPWWQSWRALATFSAVGLALLLLAVPALWRARLRRRRLGSGRHLPGSDRIRLTDEQVLAAWQELVDSAWDLGIPPDDASTPRRTVARIAEIGSLDPDARAAAGRVALATEQVLYARETGPLSPLGADVRATREALSASVGRYGRARAVLLPPSTARLWWRATERVSAAREAVGERWDRLAQPVRRAVRKALRRPPADGG